MGSHYNGRIEIGGKLPRSKFAKFVEIAAAEGAGLDWDCADELTEESLLEFLGDEDKEPLHLMSSSAQDGHFEQLEKWLHEQGMDYLTWIDAYYELEPQVEGIVSGVKFVADTDNSGELTAPMAALVKAYDALKRGAVYDAMTELAKEMKIVPKIPPFELVDE